MPLPTKKRTKFPVPVMPSEKDTSNPPPPLYPIQTQSAPPPSLSTPIKKQPAPPRPTSSHATTSTPSLSPKSKESVILEHLAKISIDSPLTAADGEEEDAPMMKSVPSAQASSSSSSTSSSPPPSHRSPTQGTLLSPRVYQAFQQAKQPKWMTEVPPAPHIQVSMSPKYTGEGYLPVIAKDPMVAIPVFLPGLGVQYVLTPMLPMYLSTSKVVQSPDDDVALKQLKIPGSMNEKKR
ncbi:hypothetical protein HMI54_006536 [Coelomomyces lativittatus]|nr:hypothetical protein HMI56_002689 [Coelomomyces lativittatus]KAJ1513114.1 hypothetical protein HMI55_005893 [Coelomomyces lativittatus]KAJ1517215.1 hypothetical protein HMI54_006536 [Coelomomyces lativittatus]